MTYPVAAPSILQMSITHPSPAYELTVIGAGDTDLDPAIYASSFVNALNGYSLISSRGGKFGISDDGRILVKENCECIIEAYADISHSANNSTVGAAFSIERNGSVTLSSRAVHAKLPSQSDIGNISGVGTATGSFRLMTGDLLGVAFASDNSGTVSIRSSSVVIEGY